MKVYTSRIRGKNFWPWRNHVLYWSSPTDYTQVVSMLRYIVVEFGHSFYVSRVDLWRAMGHPIFYGIGPYHCQRDPRGLRCLANSHHISTRTRLPPGSLHTNFLSRFSPWEEILLSSSTEVIKCKIN